MNSTDLLAELDEAFAAEIKNVSSVSYNSNAICRLFYANLRKRLASRAPAQALGGEALREVLAPFVHDENYIEGRFGIIDDDDDTVESASSFEQAIELWRECSAREPNERFSITGWNHATLVYGHDVERLFGPLKGTFDCPICGKAEPHEHSGAEVADQRRHEQWMQKNNEEKRQEILRRVASVNEKYGQRPNLDAAVSAVAALASRAPAQALGREPKRFALLWKEITSRWYAVSKAKTDSKLAAFDEGVRFAEAHHFGGKLENRPVAAYETQPDGSVIAVDPAALAHRATAQAPELGAIVNAADAAGIPVQLAVGQEGVSIDALRKFAALVQAPEQPVHLKTESVDDEQRTPLTARLMKFYGVTTMQELVEAQSHHVDRLQAKLPATPSLAPTFPRG